MANSSSRQLYRPDGHVSREVSISPSVRGNVLEYRGTRPPTGEILTIKRRRFASEHTNEVLFVVVLARVYANCFLLALNLGSSQPRKHSRSLWNYCGERQYNINSGGVYG